MNNLETYGNVAAIGVDIQNDFCPGGALGVKEGDQVVAPFNSVARWTRDQGGQVIFTRDQHPPETTHFHQWPVHCVRNTPGGLFHPGLEVLEHEAGDIVVSKGMGAQEDAYSGFDALTVNGRKLEYVLDDNVERGKPLAILIGGLATDYCVKATALDAQLMANKLSWTHLRVGVFVVKDAIRAVNIEPHDGEEALAEMEAAGIRLITAGELVDGQVLEVKG